MTTKVAAPDVAPPQYGSHVVDPFADASAVHLSEKTGLGGDGAKGHGPTEAVNGAATAYGPTDAVNGTAATPGVGAQEKHQYDDSPSSPDSYIRDPHKLVAYIVPFPSPTHLPSSVPAPPLRFLIYTPPPPPLLRPSEGEKEKLSHKMQRKWQAEVREAKESDAKVASWKGIKSRVTKGISWGVGHVTSADLDFLTRIPKDGEKMPTKPTQASARTSVSEDSSDGQEEDGTHEGETTNATVKLEEMVLVYPPSIGMSVDQLRTEFINSLMRTKSKAQKDAVIATGLLPVALALDWALMFVGWIFGGALEVDGVWMAASYKGAKTARSVTKRLSSSSSGNASNLSLKFIPSERSDVLQQYLLEKCIQRDQATFNRQHTAIPSEEDVMRAIGWQASGIYEKTYWEDEAWEKDQVVDDLRKTMSKAAKTWDKWVKKYEENPDKVAKK
ncbi:hypothetical protein EHS25_010165 [Saitozyma podzolica]|uniref:Secreted protein n=1 Tax=Saitozyma podzolica TaxID=1890683 RepID=A0A427YIU4_9TREE|nr:hypothetical protein EHS25_010165 [Saitozyma podzolica]